MAFHKAFSRHGYRADVDAAHFSAFVERESPARHRRPHPRRRDESRRALEGKT